MQHHTWKIINQILENLENRKPNQLRAFTVHFPALWLGPSFSGSCIFSRHFQLIMLLLSVFILTTGQTGAGQIQQATDHVQK